MQSQTAMPVFDLVAFDWDGENTGERVGGRAEGEDATAIRHGETTSLPVDSGEERPAVDEDQEELRAGAGDSGLMLYRPDEPIPGTPPVITHRFGTAGAIAKTGYVAYSCLPLENHDGEPMEVAFACGVSCGV